MFSWLKKHFIPHEGNEHRPHILRDLGTRNIIAIVIFLELFTFLIPIFSHISVTGQMADVLPAVLDDLTNGERQSQNLPALTVSPLLTEAAQMKANDMATNGYFSHTSPTGKTPWYWLEQVGYNYQFAGENLAINFTDSQDVTNAWMASPEHRANIEKGQYTEVGTGVATGMYQGKQAIFVAQDFANPLPTPAPSPASEQAQAPTQPTKTIVATTPPLAPTVVAPESPEVLGAQTVTPSSIPITPAKAPTVWQKLIASPRQATDIILYIVFIIIVISLLLYVLIKRKNHHIDLITNGLVVIAVLGAIFVGNYYITHRNMVITQSLDYSNQSK